MHNTVRFTLVFALLFAGCSDSIEDDLEMSGSELREKAEGMSEAELEKKIDELEAYAKKLGEGVDEDNPSEAEMVRMTKVVEVTGIYATALMKKKMG